MYSLKSNGKWKKRWHIITSALSLAAFLCTASGAVAGEIRVGGTVDECYGYFGLFKEVIKDEIKVDLLITPSSSVRAMMDLDRGKVDVVTADESLDSILAQLVTKGYPVTSGDFQVQGLGTKSILVYLNKANEVSELSQRQLSDIFTGKITNWKQVGGHDGEIVVVWGDDPPELNRLFQKYVISDKPVVKTALWAADEKEVIERIVRTPGAIGIASHVYQSGRTRSPRTPFVSSKAIAITKGAPSSELQQVLEMIKLFD